MGNFKAVRPHGDADLELYDLDQDVGETNNIANQHPGIIDRMREVIKTCRTKPRPQIEPDAPGDRRFR
jgi:hypothetical protein